MTTKVEKSGLLPIVKALVDENPAISDQKVANKLMRDYKDKLEDGKITWYAVRNARKKLAESQMRELAEANPETGLVDLATEQFNKILMEGVDNAKDIYDEARDTGDLKIALQGLEQVRKNLVSIKDFAEKNIIQPQQNLTINEHLTIISDLRQFQKFLCPNCRTRINQELLTDA